MLIYKFFNILYAHFFLYIKIIFDFLKKEKVAKKFSPVRYKSEFSQTIDS